MRAGLRWTKILLAGALLLAAAPVLAQAVPDTTSNTPADRCSRPARAAELQPARHDHQARGPAARGRRQPPGASGRTRPSTAGAPRAAAAVAGGSSPPAPSPRASRHRRPVRSTASSATQPPERVGGPTAAVLAGDGGSIAAACSAAPALCLRRRLRQPPSTGASASAPAMADRRAGSRRRSVPYLAQHSPAPGVRGCPTYDLFVAPEPNRPHRQGSCTAPKHAPCAGSRSRCAPAPAAREGIVASRLRPWIEIDIQPLRCIVDDEQVTFEFEVELFNSGNAPARDVLVEASLFNAGADAGAGTRRLLRPAARDRGADRRDPTAAPDDASATRWSRRARVPGLSSPGARSFVPLLAFNALYRLERRRRADVGQLPARPRHPSDKLGPLRLDLGPRIFRGLGARPLPTGAADLEHAAEL